MKWLVVGALFVLTTGLVVLAVGWILPVGHVASRSASLNAPPEDVWRAITTVEEFTSWRKDINKVQRLPDRDGRAVWVEEGSSGRMTMMVERSEPPSTLVTRIADRDLPFGGTWTYTIAMQPGGSTLTITEHGEVYNPVFRALARFVFGYESTMAAYLEALSKHLDRKNREMKRS